MSFHPGPAGSLYRLRTAACAAARAAQADIRANSPLQEHEALARIEALVALADSYIQQIHHTIDRPSHDPHPHQPQNLPV